MAQNFKIKLFFFLLQQIVSTTDDPKMAEVFVENWISQYGVPLELHTDRRRNFESNLFLEMCKLVRINKTRTATLHAQSDGMMEIFNKTLLQYLSKVAAEHQEDWDPYIPLFMLAYRSSIHESTNHTPAMVISGHELRLPCDLEFGTLYKEQILLNEFVMKT